MNKVLEKRLKFLQLEARCFSLLGTLKALNEKLRKSERGIPLQRRIPRYLATRPNQLFELDKALSFLP